MHENRCVLLKSDMHVRPMRFTLLCSQLTALIKPSWCVLLHCCASLCHSLIVVQPSWTAVPCLTTKFGLLISKPFVWIKQSVIGVALKTPLKTRLRICIYKTSLPHRPDDYIGFTSSCPPTFYNKIAPMPTAKTFLHQSESLISLLCWLFTCCNNSTTGSLMNTVFAGKGNAFENIRLLALNSIFLVSFVEGCYVGVHNICEKNIEYSLFTRIM